MVDPLLRRVIDPALATLAEYIPPRISANTVTLIGFGLGLAACVCVGMGAMAAAAVLLLLNRLADGLDGMVARRLGGIQGSDLGAYLDIIADFFLWALLPIAFVVANPDNALAAAVLLSSFAMSMTAFLAFAVMAEKRALTTQAQGQKGMYYLAGLAEGTETIVFFLFVMALPQHFSPAAVVFAGFVTLSALARVFVSWRTLSLPITGTETR